ncbi:endo alpha-1,4 polygalactosaminidase [Legionella sp. D16C41]|uniref:endo alpha-1,4 polygalactosaminidase n=1 Tax=Legionella sp. D16C41 TaxID=3402688 RepID=UPI003AF438FF
MKKLIISLFALGVFTSPTSFAERLEMPSPVPCSTCSSQITQGERWNYILSASPKFSVLANVYDIDGFDNSAATVQKIHNQGNKAICYISAGTWENWRPDANQFPASVKGKANGWPGEKWLDIRQTSILLPIMQARINMCKEKGFDAVEFDNVDGYTNKTGFPLNSANQAFYNASLANMAHRAGLAVGLKNDIDQVTQLVRYFDFAINEQCFEYNECDTLSPFIKANKAVLNVEYNLSTSKFCSKANSMRFSSIKKDMELTEKVTFCN